MQISPYACLFKKKKNKNKIVKILPLRRIKSLIPLIYCVCASGCVCMERGKEYKFTCTHMDMKVRVCLVFNIILFKMAHCNLSKSPSFPSDPPFPVIFNTLGFYKSMSLIEGSLFYFIGQLFNARTSITLSQCLWLLINLDI